MKRLKILLSMCFIFFVSNTVLANQYSEEDKQLFYNAFIDSYIMEMQKVVDSLNIEQSKKDLFIKNLKKDIDKDYLIKSSWDCIQKFPIESIVQASILCTSDWNKKQSEKNKRHFEMLKMDIN